MRFFGQLVSLVSSPSQSDFAAGPFLQRISKLLSAPVILIDRPSVLMEDGSPCEDELAPELPYGAFRGFLFAVLFTIAIVMCGIGVWVLL